MTLVAPRKAPRTHHKRNGRHQHKHKNFAHTYWPYLPLALIVTTGFILNSLWPTHKSVLGYATDMSIQELLTDTNSQRSSHGLTNLHLNSELDRAAQNKAADMAAKDYWSHNSPSGRTPWSFITAAGYHYQTAGENLAYGFYTAADTLTGWMNSPEHRANILNTSYKDVGFGIINIPDYQSSGPQTLVVAMYASPVRTIATSGSPTKASPSASQPLNTSSLKQSTPVASKPSSVPASAKESAPKKSNPAPTTVTTKQDTVTPTAQITKDELPQQKISRIQLVANGENEWSMMATLVIVTVALALLIVRHGFAWHRLLNRSERFVLKHPVLDMVATSLVVVGIILTHTAGVIR